MIKIKNNIFNENRIVQMCINEKNNLEIDTDNGFPIVIKDATLDDIEWNYGTPQETQRQMQKELCKSCYYRDTISNKLKELEEENKKLKEVQCTFLGTGCKRRLQELEEENKTLKELNVCVGCNNNPDYKSRIDKAIEIIEDVPKKIEKLKIYENCIDWCCNGRVINDTEKDIIDKINEIIDKINGEKNERNN